MRRRAAIAAAALFAYGCTLEEVTVVDVEDVVVAEVLVQLERSPSPDGGANRITAFLHRTVGGSGPGYHPVPGARVIVGRADGLSVELAQADLFECASTTPVGGTGTCYVADRATAQRFHPGDELDLTIVLPDGGVIVGASDAPGDFEPRNVVDGGVCAVPADTPLELRWTPAAGAWAYVNETSISGLAAALGTDVADPLYLLGLSISAMDTTIVFPGEFGLFNRFELDRTVALALQDGLPAGTSGKVTIAAVDRNYVNWVRGGNFNPSGQVRLPSLRGAGTGLFGSVVVRRFDVATTGTQAAAGAVACTP